MCLVVFFSSLFLSVHLFFCLSASSLKILRNKLHKYLIFLSFLKHPTLILILVLLLYFLHYTGKNGEKKGRQTATAAQPDSVVVREWDLEEQFIHVFHFSDTEGPVLQLIIRISKLASLIFMLSISTEFVHRSAITVSTLLFIVVSGRAFQSVRSILF